VFFASGRDAYVGAESLTVAAGPDAYSYVRGLNEKIGQTA